MQYSGLQNKETEGWSNSEDLPHYYIIILGNSLIPLFSISLTFFLKCIVGIIDEYDKIILRMMK